MWTTFTKLQKTLSGKIKYRRISEPVSMLKNMHWEIKKYLDQIPLSSYAYGFVSSYGTRDNAMIHRNQRYILNVDIKNFFPNITRNNMMVILEEVFEKYSLDFLYLDWIKEVCFLDERLPQGAPTSPVLSNIYLTDLDNILALEFSKRNFRFTRYADDITISGGDELKIGVGSVISLVEQELAKLDLRLNKKKTKMMPYYQKQLVNGILVNNDKLSFPRETKSRLYFDFKDRTWLELTESEIGYIEYIDSVDPVFGSKIKAFLTENTQEL